MTAASIYAEIYDRVCPRPTPAQCRQIADAHSNCPIKWVDGDEAPAMYGRSWHYTTLTGIPIHHPSAYSRRGWSSMVYHCSTMHVRVGRDYRLKGE